MEILAKMKLFWNEATFRGQRVCRYYWILRIRKTINQSQNEFQKITGRIKVIIQTLDDTYTKDNFQTATKATSGPVEWLPQIFGRDTGGPRLARILGPKGFVLSEELI